MTETDSLTDGEPMPAAPAPATAPKVTLLEGQPVAVIGALLTGLDGAVLAASPLPEWLTVVLVVLVNAAALLGIRSRVTPVARPRDNAGEPLTP